MICTLVLMGTLCSQSKVEVESRVSADLVPQKAKQFIQDIDGVKHLKWFQEVSEEGTHYEAKFNKSMKYSVEFDSSGELLDVEIQLRINEHKSKFLSPLSRELGTSNFLITKIQHQWTSSSMESLLASISNENRAKGITLNYEIEVKTKDQKGIQRFEVLLDEQLNLIRKREISSANTDNLIY